MASAAQITANQANARFSTGPRTAEGKAASAQNNTSHGLCSRQFVILAGEEQEFTDFMTELHAAIQPVGAIERDLFTQHAHASWTLRRCRSAEVATQFEAPCNGDEPMLANEMAERLKRIDLYARRAERTYHKTIKQLQDLQLIRLSPAVSNPITSSIQSPYPIPALVDPIQVNVQRHASIEAAGMDMTRRTFVPFQDDDGNPVNPHVELNNLPQPKPFTPFAVA